jgi:threonine dehydrogenase-like Zn-dependent dehydrogenase
MLAKAKRAKIIMAVDISERALEKAKTLGATHTIHVQHGQSSEELAKRVQKALPAMEDGVDLSIDAAGFIATSEAAVYATRPGGIMTQVGLPHGLPAIPMALVAGKEITIVGSHGFDVDVLPDLLELIAVGVDPCLLVDSEVTLEQGCHALEDMDRKSPLGMVMITKFDSFKVTPRL